MLQDAHATAPAADGGTDAWGAFRVSSPTEAVGLLRQLRDGNVPVNLSAPDGGSVTTTLWSIDVAQQHLSFAADHVLPQLQRLVDADEVMAVAFLDSVKLQFDLHDLMLVHATRASALQAAWPDSIYRFQRRSAFRVRTPERRAPTARLHHPAIPDMSLALRIVDISIGGCALALPMDVPPLQPGSALAGIEIVLDAATAFTATLHLHHVSSIQPGEGGSRLGCSWVQLGPAAERLLQRYIDQTQKRRRLLSPGTP